MNDKYNRVKKIVEGLSDEEKKSMTHVNACKIIACEPSVMILAKIVDDHPEVDFKKTKTIVQEINKRLYKMNKYKAPSIMVGAALYLGNKYLNQEEAAKLVNISGVSLRTILTLTKLKYKDKWEEEYDKRYDKRYYNNTYD